MDENIVLRYEALLDEEEAKDPDALNYVYEPVAEPVEATSELPEIGSTQWKFLQNLRRFPEDPDGIRAKSEQKKVADNEFRHMVMRKREFEKKRLAGLQQAREAKRNGK